MEIPQEHFTVICINIIHNFCFKNKKNILKNYFYLIIFSLTILFFSCSSEPKKNNTPNEPKIVSDTVKQSNTTTDNYSFKIFESNNPTGFGYDIYKNEKPYIHQPTIPAIQGLKAFKNKTDAENIAKFVINKLSKTNALPAVDIKELDSLKVNYK